MKRNVLLAVLSCMMYFSCASGIGILRDVREIRDVGEIDKKQEITYKNTVDILEAYTMDFVIPNPLYGETNRDRARRSDPNHEATINCNTVLLDEFSTDAHIQSRCLADSLDDDQCKEFRKNYLEQHVRERMFRILIAMESGFSPKSMEPDHWAMYIENADGVMIEPADIQASPITTVEDSVYSDYYKVNFPRRLLKRDITLYFKNKTFFGELLLGGENQFIAFTMSRKKKTLTRVAWKISNEVNH